jgi:hypothetical protein
MSAARKNFDAATQEAMRHVLKAQQAYRDNNPNFAQDELEMALEEIKLMRATYLRMENGNVPKLRSGQ